MLVRPYRQRDASALHAICIATADLGDPGDHLYEDAALLHLVFLDPYLEFEPDLAFVVQDEAGAAGYAVGTADTDHFHARWAEEWSPHFVASHPDPADLSTADDHLARLLHHPGSVVPAGLAERYQAHLHIDLLPRVRGRGAGRHALRVLLAALAAAGADGVFVGVDPRNAIAAAFYRSLGFATMTADGVWMARTLPQAGEARSGATPAHGGPP
jgi:ribosomal protein S18 acetylase RimI-like enzyme